MTLPLPPVFIAANREPSREPEDSGLRGDFASASSLKARQPGRERPLKRKTKGAYRFIATSRRAIGIRKRAGASRRQKLSAKSLSPRNTR
jgi:hypothetical protein